MNLVLHNKAAGEIRAGNTFSAPRYFEEDSDDEVLKRFDFAVANPPFSLKNWTDGLKDYGRFDGYGDRPPEKNGDFAWLLHILKSLKSTGKAAVILPHGVLFRGNAEATIRKANALTLSGDKAILTVRKESSPKQRESFVNEWYRNLLKQEVAKYLPKWEKTTGLYCSSWQSKYMTTKWGTCNTNTQKIWLNLQLAKKPIESLEYVILHELAHLKVKSHGPEFVAILNQYMPQWQERKKLLNESKLDYMDSDFKKDLNNKSGLSSKVNPRFDERIA